MFSLDRCPLWSARTLLRDRGLARQQRSAATRSPSQARVHAMSTGSGQAPGATRYAGGLISSNGGWDGRTPQDRAALASVRAHGLVSPLSTAGTLPRHRKREVNGHSRGTGEYPVGQQHDMSVASAGSAHGGSRGGSVRRAESEAGMADLDELAKAVDLAARTHAGLEARCRDLDAASQSFQWTTVEAREALLSHFERVRREVLDVLDQRQLTLLKQLDLAAAAKQASVAQVRRVVRAAANQVGDECRRCRQALDDDVGAGAARLTSSLMSCVAAAGHMPPTPDLGPKAFGVALDNSFVDLVKDAASRECSIVGYEPVVKKTVVYDEALRGERSRVGRKRRATC